MGRRYTVEGYEPGSNDNVYCNIIDNEMDATYMFSDICNMVEEQCPNIGPTRADKITLEVIDELYLDESITDDLQVLVQDYIGSNANYAKPLRPPCCNPSLVGFKTDKGYVQVKDIIKSPTASLPPAVDITKLSKPEVHKAFEEKAFIIVNLTYETNGMRVDSSDLQVISKKMKKYLREAEKLGLSGGESITSCLVETPRQHIETIINKANNYGIPNELSEFKNWLKQYSARVVKTIST